MDTVKKVLAWAGYGALVTATGVCAAIGFSKYIDKFYDYMY